MAGARTDPRATPPERAPVSANAALNAHLCGSSRRSSVRRGRQPVEHQGDEMVFRTPRSSARSLCCLLVVFTGAFVVGGAGAARQATDPCGIPTTAPVWIDYAEGSVAPDIRALFAQPGVVVTASGTVIPRQFR